MNSHVGGCVARSFAILHWAGLFYLRLVFYLWLVFVASSVFCLQLKVSLVFFAHGWIFSPTVENHFGLLVAAPPRLEIGIGLFFTWWFPHHKQKRRTASNKTSTVSKKDASFCICVWKATMLVLSVHVCILQCIGPAGCCPFVFVRRWPQSRRTPGLCKGSHCQSGQGFLPMSSELAWQSLCGGWPWYKGRH